MHALSNKKRGALGTYCVAFRLWPRLLRNLFFTIQAFFLIFLSYSIVDGKVGFLTSLRSSIWKDDGVAVWFGKVALILFFSNTSRSFDNLLLRTESFVEAQSIFKSKKFLV